ncbi:MAG TPA: hypothetical protein VND93_23560, partial [Myxococcales bacterium]|nr:hypothetical protein [Myxococcales bacterium]
MGLSFVAMTVAQKTARSTQDPKDPRYRPFRVGTYAAYLVLVSVFSLLIIKSVVGSVMQMTPPRRPPADAILSVAECLQTAEALFRELEQERARLSSTFPAARTDDSWGKFRIGWMERLRDAESRCALESRAREPLREVFARLSRVMDLFTTSAVQ